MFSSIDNSTFSKFFLKNLYDHEIYETTEFFLGNFFDDISNCYTNDQFFAIENFSNSFLSNWWKYNEH